MLLFFPELEEAARICETHDKVPSNQNFENMFNVWTRLIVYRDKESHERSVLEESHPAGDRQILCCVKRTYGAAFSGYPTSDSDYEGTVLDTFVREAGKCRFQPSKTVPARRRQLHKSATHFCNVVKAAIGNEAKKYIWHIASTLLDSQSNPKWNMFTNNCQRLTDRLLKGKDFEYVFPRLPAGFPSLAGSEEWKHFEWPRYLISFGDRVEGQSINIQQPNSCVTKFCEQIGSTEDIIDFLELEIDQAELGSGNHIFKDLKELALITPQPHTEVYRTTAEDALWDLPRDSLSILQFHLRRPFAKYSTATGQNFDETQWMDGRLRVLQQLDIIACYAGALGLALLEMFRQKPDLVNKVEIPKSRIFGSLRSNEKARVARSGGLVRYIISQRQYNIGAERLSEAVWQSIFHSFATEVFASRIIKSTINLKVMLQSMKSQFRDVSDPYNKSSASFEEMTGLDDLMQINQRDNWEYLRVGSILIAHQFYRKSKNTRKAMKKTNWLDILQKKHELRNRWKSQKHNPNIHLPSSN
ncbi:MAG: hypothetical protein Q9198_004437 [Flavoplaca austrocitrina]